MDPQGISPLSVVPPSYPHLPMRELIVKNLNFNPLQYATTNMHCRRGWTVATESNDGIGCSESVEETSQFPEQNQGRERMRASRFLRQQTLDRSVNPNTPHYTLISFNDRELSFSGHGLSVRYVTPGNDWNRNI